MLNIKKLKMGRKIVVEKGDRYGRLVVIKEVEKAIQPSGHKERVFLCQCNCGSKPKKIRLGDLRKKGKNRTVSCGCYSIENKTTHGDSNKHYLNTTWKNIKQRCYNENNTAYMYYGGKEENKVVLYEPWINDYQAFKDWILENLGERPTDEENRYSIDRINNNGNYFPGNIRWVDYFVQANNKSNNITIIPGKKSGKLTIIKEIEPIIDKHNHNKRMVLLKCDCGNTKEVLYASFKGSKTTTCGKCNEIKIRNVLMLKKQGLNIKQIFEKLDIPMTTLRRYYEK